MLHLWSKQSEQQEQEPAQSQIHLKQGVSSENSFLSPPSTIPSYSPELPGGKSVLRVYVDLVLLLLLPGNQLLCLSSIQLLLQALLPLGVPSG